MIVARQDVAIYLQQVKGSPAYTEEFQILVKDNGVAESISKLDLHDCRGECGCIGTGDGLQSSERAHTTTSDDVGFGSFETRMRARHIRINM